MKKVITIAALLISFYSYAQDRPFGVPTGAEFLNVNTDTRSAGMGNLRTVPVSDANAIFSNPARVAFPTKSLLHDVAITYNPLVTALTNDIKMLSLATTHYVGGDDYSSGYFTGFLQYLSYGDVFFTDDQGNETDYYRPKEFAIGAGYIKRYGEYFSLGLDIKGIYSQLGANRSALEDATNGFAFAMDVGVYSELPVGYNHLHLGLAIQNLGTGLSYSGGQAKSMLPQVIRMGIGYRVPFDDESYLFFGTDINKPLIPSDYDPKQNSDIFDAIGKSFSEISGTGVSFGTEVMFQDRFGIRTGYSIEPTQFNRTNLFTVGVTLTTLLGYNRFALDGAYQVPMGKNAIGTGSMLKIGLSYQIFE